MSLYIKVEASKLTIKQVLEVLASGGSYDYAPILGDVMLFDGKGGRVERGVDMANFLELREKCLISMGGSMRQGHLVFPSNARVDFYGITNQGREYLNK